MLNSGFSQQGMPEITTQTVAFTNANLVVTEHEGFGPTVPTGFNLVTYSLPMTDFKIATLNTELISTSPICSLDFANLSLPGNAGGTDFLGCPDIIVTSISGSGVTATVTDSTGALVSAEQLPALAIYGTDSSASNLILSMNSRAPFPATTASVARKTVIRRKL
jgi:hypothetical protein